MHQELSKELKSFGLNPREWHILLKSNSQVELVHQNHQDFKLQGRVRCFKGRWEWLSLNLLSF